MKSFVKWMESFQIKEDLFNRTPQVPNSKEDKEKIISWKSNPAHAYKNPKQAKEMEQKARGRAAIINKKYNNKVKVYKTIALDDFEQRIYNIINSIKQISVSIGEKAKGVWNTELVISGIGRIEYYYAKDVSTNLLDDNSTESLPITPLNPTRSHYDEALVFGKEIIWDTLYYSPEIGKKIPNFEQIAQRFNLKLVSTKQSGLPSPITYTQELEKNKKLKLDT